jgi:ATP-dependent RNA helicase RhlE
VSQVIYPVGRERKSELLAHLISERQWFQVLVFTRTKHSANTVAEYLIDHDIKAMAIHGNKSQANRTKALGDFKQNKLQVLVATDIAARGIDIDQLEHVVNYDLPNVPEDYVHRIGRTGRAGASGEAVSLYTIDEENFLRDIERLIKQDIRRETIVGFELNPDDKPQPIKMGRTQLLGAKIERPAGSKPPGMRKRNPGPGFKPKSGQAPSTPRAPTPRAPTSSPPAAKPRTGSHAHARGTGLNKGGGRGTQGRSR